MSLNLSDPVTSIIIGVFQQMQDEKRKPLIADVRKKYGCEDLSLGDANSVVSRIRDAVDNGVSLSLTTEETKTLFAYMLRVETDHELQRMTQRMSNYGLTSY